MLRDATFSKTSLRVFIHLRAQWPQVGDEHPAYAPAGAWFPFLPLLLREGRGRGENREKEGVKRKGKREGRNKLGKGEERKGDEAPN